jgi:hypothetical protein
MRVVVSGTHATGKSTLIGGFASAHPDWVMLPDPFEDVDAAADEPDAGTFFTQLRLSAARLEEDERRSVIAERGPVDFLAYLDALSSLGRPTRSAELFRRGIPIAARAMRSVDLLIVVPLEARRIDVDDEDPVLREAMDAALLDLVDDPDVIGDAVVVEIAGDPASRLAQLESAIAAIAG